MTFEIEKTMRKFMHTGITEQNLCLHANEKVFFSFFGSSSSLFDDGVNEFSEDQKSLIVNACSRLKFIDKFVCKVYSNSNLSTQHESTKKRQQK